MPVVRVVAHVGIVRTLEAELPGRPVERADDLAVARLCRDARPSATSTVRVGRGAIVETLIRFGCPR